MTPEEEFNAKPLGSDPAEMLQMYGFVPPMAAIVVEYATLA
jgi:hypothetical protein